jgi:acetolactate synthase-1/2/3 large subunit
MFAHLLLQKHNRSGFQFSIPERPTGDITPENWKSDCVLPENAIVVESSVSTGRNFVTVAQTARHDWLCRQEVHYAMPWRSAPLLPARIECHCLESDGSGMYMPQTLWTQAREGLNILTLIFANRKYQILYNEMTNVGVSNVGPKASALIDIDRPVIDWLSLARTFGIESFRAETMDGLSRCIDAGLAIQGPCLIEIVM